MPRLLFIDNDVGDSECDGRLGQGGVDGHRQPQPVARQRSTEGASAAATPLTTRE